LGEAVKTSGLAAYPEWSTKSCQTHVTSWTPRRWVYKLYSKKWLVT